MNRDDVKEQDPENNPWDNIFNRVGQMVSELAALRARNARLVGLLKRIEWPEGLCPICYECYGKGHSPDCALAAAIKENQQ